MFTIYQKLTLVDVHLVVNIQFISYKWHFVVVKITSTTIFPFNCYNILHIC